MPQYRLPKIRQRRRLFCAAFSASGHRVATRHPIEIIAKETDFGDRERMHQAFLRAFGQSPQTIQCKSGVPPITIWF
jgi:AraC-like DNA-binding protein